MEPAEYNQQSSSQITNLVNRQCNIQDQQSFLEIFTQENEKNVKQKLNDKWIIQTTQSKLKEVETVHEAQKATIQEFQMKNKQLELKLCEEIKMRTVVMDKLTKIQKAMSLYVESYNLIKDKFKSCENTKTKLNNLYDSLLQDNAEVKRYNATITKKYEDQINELTTTIAKMKERFTKAVDENAKLDLKNEEALHNKTQTIKMLEKRVAELTHKNTNLQLELSEAVSQKESLINDVTKLQGNCESLQGQLNENTAEYNTKVANLNQIIEDNKESIEKLEAERNNLQAAFDHQNDRMNEILSKNNTLENSVSEFEQSDARLRNMIEELEKQRESDRSTYSDELHLLKEKVVSREDEYSELNARYLQMKQESSLEQEKMVQLESKLSERKIEIETFKETVATCKTEIDRLRKDNEETDSQLKSKIDKMEEQSKNFREEVQRLSEERNNWKMHSSKLECDLQEKEKKNANDREMQQVKIRSLQSEIEVIKEKNQEKLNEVEAKSQITVNQMKDQTEFYKSEIDKIRDAERSKHMKEIESLNDRLRLVEFQKSELATSKQYLQAELEKKLFDNVQPPTQKKALETPPPSHQSISQANRAQKATIASTFPRTFRAWDESDSDSSCDRKITDLKRRTTDNFRIVPRKRPSSPSSASEQGSSPKREKIDITSEERMDKLFDTLRDTNFREPAEKKSLRSRKPQSRKPVI